MTADRPGGTRYLGDIMTAGEVCETVGRSRGWLSQLVTAGAIAPCDRDGPRASARYRLADVVRMCRERQIDISAWERRVPPSIMRAAEPEEAPEAGAPVDWHEERALHERRKRELTELRLAESRRELIPAVDVAACMGRISVSLREHVLAIESVALVQMDPDAHAWLCGELRATLHRMADDFEAETGRLLRERDIGEARPAMVDADAEG